MFIVICRLYKLPPPVLVCVFDSKIAMDFRFNETMQYYRLWTTIRTHNQHFVLIIPVMIIQKYNTVKKLNFQAYKYIELLNVVFVEIVIDS